MPGPKPSGTAPAGSPAPYPSAPAPYPSAPAGTGVVPAPPVGSGTGVPSKPTPTEYFTGAASLNNAAGFVAGLGAFAAFFL